MASSEDFDPFQQSFTLVLLDGTPFNVTIPDLDDFVRYSVQISINYAAQLGASLIFLIVLLLLTKPEKRKSPVFILNSVALAINVVRNLLQCLYYTGPFSEIYTYFSQDYSRVTASDYASQVTITVLSLLLLVCAELSLIMQVWVVCVTLRDLYKQGVTAFLVLVACLAVGFRFAFTIENAKLILSLNPPTSLNWLASASNIVTTISICLFSAVFIIKLGFALEQRRQLGMNHFGPMQILFIMGCQTLLIPAIFSIIQYFVPLPSMGSNVLTLVCIFLPLSSLWASASIANRPRNSPKQVECVNVVGTPGTATTGPFLCDKSFYRSPTLSDVETATLNHSNASSPTNNMS